MIAAPRFYAARLGPPFAAIEDVVAASSWRPLSPLLTRPGLLRGLAIGLRARRGDGAALIRRERGTLPALWVCALPPASRRIFVLELIRRPLPHSSWRRLLYRLWLRLVERPALRRGMAAGQVMTAWELEEYSRHYGIDRTRLEHVAWPLREGGDRPPEPIDGASRRVFASGRTACDWETLFAAASGSAWQLAVACAARDAGHVRNLATRTATPVHVEVSWEEHARLLRRSAVFVLSISDRGLSAGHVRLMTAVEAGVPVVASDVPSLHGYVAAGETAVLVSPADPAAMRAAVDELLADAARRRVLREQALAHADGWSYVEYFAALRVAICDAIAGGPGGARDV